ncbi:MAG: aldolase/citrate lyase family protein [Victivallaceae bacterium]|nr:aldolase/citrate lyase family protein [Victivallaceae bacterium]
MKQNQLHHFLEKIASGKIATGCCVTLADSSVSEIAAAAGMDFCWLDGEHGIIDRYAMLQHVMALQGTDCAALIRVPDCSHTEIKKVIDMAPAGIIVPMVTSVEEAERVVAACRYPLTGNRGCGFRRAVRFGADPISEYLEDSKREPLVILQIEHIKAVEVLDEILAIPGIDSILVGPYDLSASMGKIGDLHDPQVNQVYDEVCRKTLAAGKILGAYSGPELAPWIARGCQYLGIANDTEAMFRYLRTLRMKI